MRSFEYGQQAMPWREAGNEDHVRYGQSRDSQSPGMCVYINGSGGILMPMRGQDHCGRGVMGLSIGGGPFVLPRAMGYSETPETLTENHQAWRFKIGKPAFQITIRFF